MLFLLSSSSSSLLLLSLSYYYYYNYYYYHYYYYYYHYYSVNNIPYQCDINCAGHFTLDALASRTVACYNCGTSLNEWWQMSRYFPWYIRSAYVTMYHSSFTSEATMRVCRIKKIYLWHVLPSLRWRITGAIASQITSLTIVYSIVYSDADQSKHQSSASLAFVRGIHRGPSTGEFPAQIASNVIMMPVEVQSVYPIRYRHGLLCSHLLGFYPSP